MLWLGTDYTRAIIAPYLGKIPEDGKFEQIVGKLLQIRHTFFSNKNPTKQEIEEGARNCEDFCKVFANMYTKKNG